MTRQRRPNRDHLRHRRAAGAALLLIACLLALSLSLSGCGSAEALAPEESEPAEEPAEEPMAPEQPEPTQAAIAPPSQTPPPTPTDASLPLVTQPTPPPVVVEAASDAPESEVIGRVDVEYPVRMAPESSDTVILQLSIPELLAAAEPVAVVRVEEAEPVSETLGRFDAVVYVMSRMRAELDAPALVIESLTPPEQDVDLTEVDTPTTWAWTVRAPDTVGKQVMTVRLFRSGDEAPSWIGSLRVDVTAPGELASSLGEESEPEAESLVLPPVEEASGAEADQTQDAEAQGDETAPPEGVIATVVQALTQDVTGLVLGILSLIGSIIAAVLAAWIERGGSLKRPSRGTPTRRGASVGGTGLRSTLRALWFRVTEAFRSRKR